MSQSSGAGDKPTNRPEWEEIGKARRSLLTAIPENRERLIKLCQALVRIDTQNPPGDTGEIANFISKWIGERPGVEVNQVVSRPPVTNLIIRLKTCKTGRRLVFNGHLDTFTVGDASLWTVPPLAGVVRDGRMFGRGVSDMKAGLAAAVLTLELLWPYRELLSGELVLVFAGDEETGGTWGTKYLLDHAVEARGDAMLSGDAGSPRVARFGEKGQMWIELKAAGRSAHGAHVHLGINAIERVLEAARRVLRLTSLPTDVPPAITEAISKATSVSEPLSGVGESEVLGNVTVNIGTIHGGTAVNIVPEQALARLDIRFPPGLRICDVSAHVKKALEGLAGVDFEILSCCEPNWTDPDHEIVRLVLKHGVNAVGGPVVANMRVGFSDARYYRLSGIPAVVYGPTPHNMGGPDENVEIADLEAILYVHALTAFDYLKEEPVP